MIIAKQMEIRNNIKKYFDEAYDGEVIIIPRKQNRNVVIISEENYRNLSGISRLGAYTGALGKTSSDRRKEMPGSESVMADNLEKLTTISRLKENWNGNGAPAFPRELIRKVRSIIKELVIQPEIFPTALQTIQLEYDNSRRDHMEIEISMDDTAEIFVSPYIGEEFFESISADAGSINRRAEVFYG